MLEPIIDLEPFVTTRTTWHTLAERVLAPARHAATGRIGLRPITGGFGTPEFDDAHRVAVVGSDLLVADGASEARHRITTLAAAAQVVGVDLGVDTGVYTPTTPSDPTTELRIDADAAAVLAGWFAFGGDVLAQWAKARTADTPSAAQLWPEHFDLALDLGPEAGRANYGASPGDAASAIPYLYVGPWDASDDPFWTGGSYASLGYDELIGTQDPHARALDFFTQGHTVATRNS